MQEQNENIKNGRKNLNWLKVRVDLIITIITLIVAFTVAWTQLDAKVAANSSGVADNKAKYNEITGQLNKINETLNDVETGLPAIHQRLKNLERYK